jgi:WhiB family redox-sensing transcriptional regulator
VSADTLPALPLADDWRQQAACGDKDPELFDFDPEVDPPARAAPAKQVCSGCQVRDACLGTALAQPAGEDAIGIYGGLTPAERAALRGRNVPQQRAERGRESWRLASDPTFARVTHELAAQIGVETAAHELGVNSRTLRRAWHRHELGPHAPQRPPQPEAARWLVPTALERLGWTEQDTTRYYPTEDPEFARSAFQLAGKVGTYSAARKLGVSTSLLYRTWDRHQLGRPVVAKTHTRQLMESRELAEQAFQLSREQSIVAAASAFGTSAPTLRRAFARHGLGHPHDGLDRAELQRRWNTRGKEAPDHRNRQQARAYRARLAAERQQRREHDRRQPRAWRQRLTDRAHREREQEVGDRER